MFVVWPLVVIAATDPPDAAAATPPAAALRTLASAPTASAGSDAEARERRPGPNTVRNSHGFCSRLADFPYGEPDTKNGCWRCDPFCHGFAACLYPGVCQCEPRYRGNGADRCDPILPQVLAISPREGYSEQPTAVNVSYAFDVRGDAEPKAAYCRFGLIYHTAEAVTPSHIQCVAPPQPPQQVNLAISFDAVHWSTEQLLFLYKKKFDVVKFLPIAAVYIICVAGFIAFIWFVFGRERRPQPQDTRDEMHPFVGPVKTRKKRRQRRGSGLILDPMCHFLKLIALSGGNKCPNHVIDTLDDQRLNRLSNSNRSLKN
jgi:hypothetical protein